MNKEIKVLLVDDEARFRETTCRILGKRGFVTVTAGNGEEAIRMIDEEPDVIVLDIRMPGMDGLQALREIKRISPDIPVIILTGHGDLSSALEFLDEGAHDYLKKPCDIDILSSKIYDAFQHGPKHKNHDEKTLGEVMIPLEAYTTLYGRQNVKDAINELKLSFTLKSSSGQVLETGHRSILVMDDNNEVMGILTIADLLRAMMPPYLNSPKPSMADSIQFSPMFWKGMFSRVVRDLVKIKIEDIMSVIPKEIDEDSNLMEAAYMMVTGRVRRLLVMGKGRAVGIIREQDLFFEIENIQNEL